MQNTDRAGTPQETVEDVYHTQNTASMELITEPAGQSLISKGEGAKVMKSSDLESSQSRISLISRTEVNPTDRSNVDLPTTAKLSPEVIAFVDRIQKDLQLFEAVRIAGVS